MRKFYALGLIETRGLVTAIEAADAMAKAANVLVTGRENTNPAMITIKCVGEVAAVKSAVDAAAAAAGKLGEVISVHVIPQPSEDLAILYPEIVIKENFEPQIAVQKPIVEKSGLPVKSANQAKTSTKVKTVKTPVKKEKSGKNNSDIKDMSVQELRHLARTNKDFPLKGRQISKANKDTLLKLFSQIK
ncbi:MAG: BMC domain-containing protein [Ignavibacteriaceae bacterium]|nr:BMC domain-containing protein [Ignavibacteriaceae bacterium]